MATAFVARRVDWVSKEVELRRRVPMSAAALVAASAVEQVAASAVVHVVASAVVQVAATAVEVAAEPAVATVYPSSQARGARRDYRRSIPRVSLELPS